MRTTIDLPDDLHAIAKRIARDRNESFSATVSDLMRRGLSGDAEPRVTRTRDGWPVFSFGGGPITEEDVRRLEDDDLPT